MFNYLHNTYEYRDCTTIPYHDEPPEQFFHKMFGFELSTKNNQPHMNGDFWK